MRIAIAQIIQESNTFVPFSTTVEHFSAQYIRRGRDVLDGLKNTKVELNGMLASIEEAGGTTNDMTQFNYDNVNIRAASSSIYNKMMEKLTNF